MRLICLLICLASLLAPSPSRGEIPDSLEKFVERPEPDFRWSNEASLNGDDGTIHQLHLVSQSWQDIVWEHALTVYEPKAIEHGKHMLLFVSGGSIGRKPSERDHEFGLRLANACGGCVAVLNQVPNQPLMGNRKEDDLITETWLKYLETGDESWPLLFPMVKSAVKAMDALEQFSAKHLKQPVEKFVITGASKRGWTSWLTPVVDRRIVGTAPIVIDVLNFLPQMQNQKATWGKYSEQIIDYTSKGLVKESAELETPRDRQLRIMMDPFTYRSRLTLPKLLIVGTNDPYWVVDAMNLYWDDLSGPKYALQVPNGDHGLGDGRDHAMNTLSIFFRHLAAAASLPTLDWTIETADGRWSVQVTSDTPLVQGNLWSATAPKLDFRESIWSKQPLVVSGKGAAGELPLPANGERSAVFGEVTFQYKDRPYSLTTLVYKK
jgi:PhoPQ-activated pathogenicity-related protein